MRHLIIAALLAGAAPAQTVVDSPDASIVKRLEPHEGEKLLRCDVEPSKPALNFGLRSQAGYLLHVPLVQYSGSKHAWSIALRVSPETGAARPTYLADSFELSANPHPELTAEVTGAFLLGEGRYHVEFALSDGEDRVCRKEWQIAPASDRSIKVAMPPNKVAGLSYSETSTTRAAASTPRRLTVLMNVSEPDAPRSRQAVSPMEYRQNLLSMLASLMEQVPGPPIRLVVFDLDQQKELLRQDGFTLKDLPKAAHASDDLEHWVVTVRQLQNQPGRCGLLTDLVDREVNAQERSDDVVFLGPRMASSEAQPPKLKVSDKIGGQRFFYLRYNPFSSALVPRSMPVSSGGRGNVGPGGGESVAYGGTSAVMTVPDLPDDIDLLVARSKGKTLTVSSPRDFAKAVEAIQRSR